MSAQQLGGPSSPLPSKQLPSHALQPSHGRQPAGAGHSAWQAARRALATALLLGLLAPRQARAEAQVQAASPTPQSGAPTAGSRAMQAPAATSSSAAPAAASPSSRGDLLDEALDAFRSAQEVRDAPARRVAFARAERLFAAAAREAGASANADLWANAGTAALQADHLGAAIVDFRRALAVDPDHRRAAQNLAHARTLLPPWVPRPGEQGVLDGLLGFARRLSPAEARGAAALAFLAAALLLGASWATGTGSLQAAALLPAAAWLALLLGPLLAKQAPGAVLVAEETVARAADSRNAPARLAEALPAGTEVTLAEVRGEWTRVQMADGRDAWVPSSSLEPVDPTVR